MSLLVTGIVVVCGVVAGRVLATSLLKEVDRRRDEKKKEQGQEGEPVVDKKKKPDTEADPLSGFPCKLGDVVLRTSGEEAWLAGCVLLSEQAPVAALFVSPDAGGDRMVFVRPAPSAELTWLAPLGEGELPVGREPPSALEHRDLRFERTRRLPLRARRLGSGAPDLGEQVLLGEYASTGLERIVVLVANGRARAFRGTKLEEGMFDVLPNGKSAFDDDE